MGVKQRITTRLEFSGEKSGVSGFGRMLVLFVGKGGPALLCVDMEEKL